MPIPDFQKLMLPVLRTTADGLEHTVAELRQRIAQELNLTPEDLAAKLKSGNGLFGNRLAWAVVYLKRAECLTSCGRGAYLITDRGRAVLEKNPGEITIKSLMLGIPMPGNAVKEPDSPSTPEEQFEQSFTVLRESLAQELLEALTKTTPSAFEQIVVDLLVSMGYGGTMEDAGEVVGKAGDGGIDGIIKQDKLGLDMVYIQAKRWQGSVGRPEVAGFSGSLAAHHANKGVMITTSHFSKDAQDFVNRTPQKIVLIDGKQLADLMIEHDVGVAARPMARKSYEIKRLDQD